MISVIICLGGTMAKLMSYLGHLIETRLNKATGKRFCEDFGIRLCHTKKINEIIWIHIV